MGYSHRPTENLGSRICPLWRTVEDFLEQCDIYNALPNKSQRKKQAKKTGITDTPLRAIIELGYDPIDVLHAWWLGICKQIFSRAKIVNILILD